MAAACRSATDDCASWFASSAPLVFTHALARVARAASEPGCTGTRRCPPGGGPRLVGFSSEWPRPRSCCSSSSRVSGASVNCLLLFVHAGCTHGLPRAGKPTSEPRTVSSQVPLGFTHALSAAAVRATSEPGCTLQFWCCCKSASAARRRFLPSSSTPSSRPWCSSARARRRSSSP